MTSPHPIDQRHLRQLHRSAITSPATIRRILSQARDVGAWLTSGMDLGVRPKRARVVHILEEELELILDNLSADRPQLHMNLMLKGTRYFFITSLRTTIDEDRIRVDLPRAIYRAERRDVPRMTTHTRDQIDLELPVGEWCSGAVIDDSYEGLGVEIPFDPSLTIGSEVRLRRNRKGLGTDEAYGRVRHIRPMGHGLQVGLSVTKVPPGPPIQVERRATILPESRRQRAWRRIQLAGEIAASTPRLFAERTRLRRDAIPTVNVVEYENDRHEKLTAIADCIGPSEGAPVIVIPPAWGRTKETLLPLAATLTRTFKAANQPLVVLRYDERNRRGESHIDPSCRHVGQEALHYTFSGAVEDIHTTLRFLSEDQRFRPSRCLLLTVSLSSIQGRRAVAEDRSGLLAGWISLVGMPDLQSSMRAVTGGIDWVYGLSQGISFGTQELVGVLVDMDNAGPDGLKHRLGYFEDARQDMAAIKVPVTWIYGEHDGWMSLERVRSLMSAGETQNRRLLRIPTGHQLRNSREALETFQLLAEEAAEMLLGTRIRARLPDLANLDRRRRAERKRRPKVTIDLRGFWREYLLGRDGSIGMELMTATGLYQRFMEKQIAHLGIDRGSHVLDLGSGTGDLGASLGRLRLSDVSVAAVDFVMEALRRAGDRAQVAECFPRYGAVVADLDELERHGLPFSSDSFDAVIASLLVGYLRRPEALLQEAFRVVRPKGRIVISAPKRDADISKLLADTVSERSPEALVARFGTTIAANFDSHQSEFLNNAAKILELEERGEFRFLDRDELEEMLVGAGFADVVTAAEFGSPPQFMIAGGEKPE